MNERTPPTLEVVHSYIRDEVEEDLMLEYKAAASLGRSDSKKREITKDVSAFANAAGGRIIFGVREYDAPERRHLPSSLDPISRLEFSKEWLGQIIDRIRPRIDDLLITPVSVDEEHVIYVVDVPQGSTAHQAIDWRYYKRRNFESVPMEDYEIRDVMGRSSNPAISVKFAFAVRNWTETPALGLDRTPKQRRSVKLKAIAENTGRRLARFVNGILLFPEHLLADWKPDPMAVHFDTSAAVEFDFDNTERDIVDVNPGVPSIVPPVYKYGPSWYAPILPGCAREVKTIKLAPGLRPDLVEEEEVRWTAYADDAPPRSGTVALRDVQWVEV